MNRPIATTPSPVRADLITRGDADDARDSIERWLAGQIEAPVPPLAEDEPTLSRSKLVIDCTDSGIPGSGDHDLFSRDIAIESGRYHFDVKLHRERIWTDNGRQFAEYVVEIQ